MLNLSEVLSVWNSADTGALIVRIFGISLMMMTSDSHIKFLGQSWRRDGDRFLLAKTIRYGPGYGELV